jgi:hypothetical protein
MMLKLDSDVGNKDSPPIDIVIGPIVESEEQYLKSKREVLKLVIGVPKSTQAETLVRNVMDLWNKRKRGENNADEVESVHSLGHIFTDVTFGDGDKTIKLELEWTTQISWDAVETTEGLGSFCSGCQEPFEVEKLSKCSVCKLACYCSKKCQKKDWKMHKEFCVKC